MLFRSSLARARPIPAAPTVSGVVSGEFDRIPDANDAFLEMVGEVDASTQIPPSFTDKDLQVDDG